jgi:hypothetical protein
LPLRYGGLTAAYSNGSSAALSKWSYSRQEVVARSTYVAGGPADEIRTQPEQDERALGTSWPGLEAAFGLKD